MMMKKKKKKKKMKKKKGLEKGMRKSKKQWTEKNNSDRNPNLDINSGSRNRKGHLYHIQQRHKAAIGRKTGCQGDES